jgi:hypothetical protein
MAPTRCAISSVVVASNASSSMRSLGRPVSGAPLRKAPSPRTPHHSSREPRSKDVAELEVEKGISRFAFIEPSIGSMTATVVPRSISPTSSETTLTSSKCLSTAASARASTTVVSSPPSPRPRTASRSSRRGSQHRIDVLDRGAAAGEPVAAHTGWKSRPERSLG